MQIIQPGWWDRLEQFVASAKKELRFASPYYGRAIIEAILSVSRPGVAKYFVLALGDREVRAGAQSPAAIQSILADPGCQIRFVKNLHAKLAVSDQTSAIVTSANLTKGGVRTNVELGLWVDELKVVRDLKQQFDGWFNKGTRVSHRVIARLAAIERKSSGPRQGTCYGKHISTGADALSVPATMHGDRFGWILVHNKERIDEGYESIEDELLDQPVEDLWHWTRPHPLREGGPFVVLFASEGLIRGEAEVYVTHRISKDARRNGFTFAFKFKTRFRARTPVAIRRVRPELRGNRDLIRLDSRSLRRYRQLAK